MDIETIALNEFGDDCISGPKQFPKAQCYINVTVLLSKSYTLPARCVTTFSSYPLTLLGDFVYSLATRFHLIPLASTDVEGGAFSQVSGTARAEAERQR